MDFPHYILREKRENILWSIFEKEKDEKFLTKNLLDSAKAFNDLFESQTKIESLKKLKRKYKEINVNGINDFSTAENDLKNIENEINSIENEITSLKTEANLELLKFGVVSTNEVDGLNVNSSDRMNILGLKHKAKMKEFRDKIKNVEKEFPKVKDIIIRKEIEIEIESASNESSKISSENDWSVFSEFVNKKYNKNITEIYSKMINLYQIGATEKIMEMNDFSNLLLENLDVKSLPLIMSDTFNEAAEQSSNTISIVKTYLNISDIASQIILSSSMLDSEVKEFLKEQKISLIEMPQMIFLKKVESKYIKQI